jgi:hypothetical protein
VIPYFKKINPQKNKNTNQRKSPKSDSYWTGTLFHFSDLLNITLICSFLVVHSMVIQAYCVPDIKLLAGNTHAQKQNLVPSLEILQDDG